MSDCPRPEKGVFLLKTFIARQDSSEEFPGKQGNRQFLAKMGFCTAGMKQVCLSREQEDFQ